MEITSATALITSPGRNYVVVRLETAEGYVGWGDATLNWRERAVETALNDHILPEVKGRDPRRIEDLWQLLFRQTYWRGGPVLNSALSGVDMALWDLKGKVASLPVYDLLGGRTREYATVYKRVGRDTVDETIDAIERELARGITHFRTDIGSAFTPARQFDVRGAVDALTNLREAIGPGPELLIDVHGRASPIEAAQLGARLEDVGLYFLEDPVRPEYHDAVETVRQHTTTPLAIGELYTNSWEMVPLIERNLVDFVRVDLAHVGGITAAHKLAHIAEHHYAKTAFHGPSDLSPVGQAATVHVDLAVPNFGIQEFTEYAEVFPETDEIFDHGAFLRKDIGGVEVPNEPGLGVEVDWDAAREYGFERQDNYHPRGEDGSVLNW